MGIGTEKTSRRTFKIHYSKPVVPKKDYKNKPLKKGWRDKIIKKKESLGK